MKGKLAAAFILSILIVGMIAPISLTDDADALSKDDYVISIPGTHTTEEPIDITIGNGKSASWSVYVVNNSKDLYLDASFSVINEDSCINVDEMPSKGMVLPNDGTGHDNILAGTFTLSVNKVTNSESDIVVKLIVNITDIKNPSSLIRNEVVFNINIESIYDTSSTYNKFFGIFENNLPAPFDGPWVPCIVSIIVWIIIAQLAVMVIAPRLAKRLDKHTTDDDAKRFETAISKLITVLVLVLSINESLGILGADASLVDETAKLSFVICAVLALLILWKVYLIVVEGILTKFEENDDSTIDMTLFPLMKMIGKITLWILGAFIVLGSFGVNLQGILVSAGVVSLGITMGAQSVLSQFFSGIVILMTRPFKKGDFLKINDKVYIVKRVKLMFTEFTGWDRDQIITMPNNAVTAATIVNLTKEDEAYRLYVYFSVAYGVDLKKAEEVMLKVANESPVVLHDSTHAAPNVRMTSFEDSGIELRLGVTVRNFNGTITDASALRMAVYQAFLDNDIEIPYNRLEVTMLNDCFKGEKRPGDVISD